MIGLIWLILALVALTLLLHVAARLLYVSPTARLLGPTPWLPAEPHEPLEEGQAVEFATDDGLRLRGTYLPTTAPRRHGVIACCHEFNGDRWNTVPYVNDLRQRGFDVFTFDFRNHGASDRTPGYQPTCWVTTYEVADVRAAVDYLCSRHDVPPQGIGLFGVGKGATAALCAAADEPRVGSLVIDGACPVRRMQIHHTRRILDRYLGRARRLLPVPNGVLGLLGAWSRWVIGRRHRCRFVDVDRTARRLRQPVLLIHGERDAHTPPELVRSLCDSIPGDASLWVVPLARQDRAIHVAGKEYRRRTTAFFLRHLSADLPWNRSPQAFRVPRAAGGAAGSNGAVVPRRVSPA